MNYKIGIIALVALQAYAASAQRPCVCARNFRPVCGSDGQTYSNDCRLECEKYNVKSDLVKVSEGPCDGALSPICVCTMEYSPVCGSDGVTYPNRCALQCKLSKNPRLYIEHERECADKVNVVNIPPCICTDNLQEVCGSDGKTYANDCLLNCATAKDPTLRISHQGKCGNVNVVGNLPVQPPCTCPRSGNPVCGSNGQTYSNDCLLNCATANDPTLRISHFGACGQVNVANNVPSGCTCSRNLEPVCGSDGVTYNNICLLQCAGQSVARYRAC